jgi:acetyl esterase/lipase
MYSGLALLMDVYRPATPKGYGIVFIAGSGWRAPLSYDATPLKNSGQAELYAVPLAEAGYTVFAINHRACKRFPYPAAVEDAQRAVRYVRYHAREYGIDPGHIGAMGGSSGGHLASLLGVMDGDGDPEDESPINRESAKVQCVVARAASCDLLERRHRSSHFLGVVAPSEEDTRSIEYRLFVEASPVSYVSPDDPPFLLIHGDADQVVSFQQSVRMESALCADGVPVKLLRVPGGGHGPTFPGAEDPPDYIAAMIDWFDRYLCQT